MKIDPECISLVKAMNQYPGIKTIESCCGHGERPFRIWFEADNLEVLPPLLYWFDACHCGYTGWNIKVTTDCAMSPVHFYVEGPVGAYGMADDIAKDLTNAITEGGENDGESISSSTDL